MGQIKASQINNHSSWRDSCSRVEVLCMAYTGSHKSRSLPWDYFMIKISSSLLSSAAIYLLMAVVEMIHFFCNALHTKWSISVIPFTPSVKLLVPSKSFLVICPLIALRDYQIVLAFHVMTWQFLSLQIVVPTVTSNAETCLCWHAGNFPEELQ